MFLRPLLLFFAALGVVACQGTHSHGDEGSTATPTGAVTAWFAAVVRGDAEASYALGTAAFADRERNWGPSFSRSIFNDGTRIDSYEILYSEVQPDGSWIVRVRAELRRADGSTDGEGMRFRVVPDGDRWLLDELK